MKSPFPGMNPYLEDPAFWGDFHPTFIQCWRKAIAVQLPAPYEARLNEHVRLVSVSDDQIKTIYPDIGVVHQPTPYRPSATQSSGTQLLEPVMVAHEEVDEVKDLRIEIRGRADRSLVTVLELLSPWNKTGDGFEQYRNKRRAVLQQRVHLVELDLLKGGKRSPMRDPLPDGDYFGYVTRSENRSKASVYSWGLRQRLPILPCPLRKPDNDVEVDLQAVLDAAFELGFYGKSLRYDEAPPIRLSEDDNAWLKQMLVKGIGA